MAIYEKLATKIQPDSPNGFLWKITKATCRYIFKSLVFIAVAGTAQLFQLVESYRDLKTIAIEEWVNEHPGNADLYSAYMQNCTGSHSINLKIDQCAVEAGVSSLIKKIENSKNQLGTLSWPLSMITYGQHNTTGQQSINNPPK